MKGRPNLGDIFGFHPGIHGIHLTGFPWRQMNKRMRQKGHNDQQHQPLRNITDKKIPHESFAVGEYPCYRINLKIRREFQLSPFMEIKGNVAAFSGINFFILLCSVRPFLDQYNFLIQNPCA